MNSKKVNMTPYYLIAIIISVWGLINTPRYPGNFRFAKIKTIGEYSVYEDHRIPPGMISSMIVDDGKIFIYYEDYAVVNIYSIDGVFQYGIQGHTIDNGRGDFSYIDQKLYLFSKAHVVYVFDQKELIEVVDGVYERSKYDYYENNYRVNNKQTTYENETYILLREQNQIIKQIENEEVQIVLDLTKDSKGGAARQTNY